MFVVKYSTEKKNYKILTKKKDLIREFDTFKEASAYLKINPNYILETEIIPIPESNYRKQFKTLKEAEGFVGDREDLVIYKK